MALLKVAFIGAGNVNFGGPEGPWDHASRLESYAVNNPSITIAVTAIVDIDASRADATLQTRKAKNAKLYETTKIYRDIDLLLCEEPHLLPDVAFIGVPPLFHGSTVPPYNLELKLAQAGIHMFIEKPLSCHPIEQVLQVNEIISKAVSRAAGGAKLVVSVGYMLRYLQAVQKMKKILAERSVVSTVARYNCTYNSILKGSWWDKTQSGGPVVEQATHFCDLSRYFGGDVDISSVRSVCVGPVEEVGRLSALPVDESSIPEHNRIPRATSAVWKYKNGAIGTLSHALLLQGYRYHSEFEVWADGIRLLLVDPYTHARLFVRLPNSDDDTEVDFSDDDMYYSELSAFLDVVRGVADARCIASCYEDAVGSYALSWAIRDGASK